MKHLSQVTAKYLASLTGFCVLSGTGAAADPRPIQRCESLAVYVLPAQAGAAKDDTVKTIQDERGRPMLVESSPVLDATDFIGARLSSPTGDAYAGGAPIHLVLSAPGRQEIANFTRMHVGRRIVFVFDGRELGVPAIISSPFTGGELIVSEDISGLPAEVQLRSIIKALRAPSASCNHADRL